MKVLVELEDWQFTHWTEEEFLQNFRAIMREYFVGEVVVTIVEPANGAVSAQTDG